MEQVIFSPLGMLRADFGQKFGTPRQGALAPSSRARLELVKAWRGRGILDGLAGFSHVWLITHLHLSANHRTRGKVHPPRLRGKKIGVLASRSPHRPNNIGLTLARVRKVDGDHLFLSEVDIVDGTPILDVKPYLAQADRPADAREGWTAELPPRAACATRFTAAADARLASLTKAPGRVRRLIAEMLALDPRPPAYLDRRGARFAVFVAGLNVVTTFDENTFTVIEIEPA